MAGLHQPTPDATQLLRRLWHIPAGVLDLGVLVLDESLLLLDQGRPDFVLRSRQLLEPLALGRTFLDDIAGQGPGHDENEDEHGTDGHE